MTADYAPYGYDEWGVPLPPPPIPSAIQTTAPVAQQSYQDYQQALAVAFEPFVQPVSYTPPELTQYRQNVAAAAPSPDMYTYTPPDIDAISAQMQQGIRDDLAAQGYVFSDAGELVGYGTPGALPPGLTLADVQAGIGRLEDSRMAEARAAIQSSLDPYFQQQNLTAQYGGIDPGDVAARQQERMGEFTPEWRNLIAQEQATKAAPPEYYMGGPAEGLNSAGQRIAALQSPGDYAGDPNSPFYGQDPLSLTQAFTNAAAGTADSVSRVINAAGKLPTTAEFGIERGGPVGFRPTVKPGPTTLASDYNTIDLGPEARALLLRVAGDTALTRTVGDLLNLGLDPAFIATVVFGGGGALGEILGRGSMRAAPYLTSMLGSQVATSAAKEAGAPDWAQLVAAVPGALLGAGAPALARAGVTGARALPGAAETYARAALQSGVGAVPEGAALRAISPETVRTGGLLRNPTEGIASLVKGAADGDITPEARNGIANYLKTETIANTRAMAKARYGIDIPVFEGRQIKQQITDWLETQTVKVADVTPPPASVSPAAGRSPEGRKTFGTDLFDAVDAERQAAWRAAGGDIDRAAKQHLEELARVARESGPTPLVPPTPQGPVRTPLWQQAEAAAPERLPVAAVAGGATPPPAPPRAGVPDFDPEKWRENVNRYKTEGDPFTDIKAKSLPRKIADNLLAIPSAWKATQASGDVLGGSGRQILPVWFAETRAAARGMAKGWEAYVTDPDAYDIIKAMDDIPMFRGGQVTTKSGKLIDVPAMADVMNLNSWQTPGFELLNDSAVARWSRNFPLLKRGDHALRANMVAAASEARARWIKQAIDAGIEDPAWFKFYDEIARAMVGAGDVPKALRGISDSFYSLQNLAARVQTFTKPFTAPGQVFRSPKAMVQDKAIFSASPRGVATRNLSRFMAGEVGNLHLLSAAGQASGLFSVGANPLGPGFGRLEFDDDDGNTYSIDLLGGYGSMIKTVTRVSDGLVNPDSKYDPAGEVFTFFRNKTAPATSLLADTVLSNLPGTKDNELYKSPWSVNLLDPKTWSTRDGAAALIERTLPFWAGETTAALVRGVYDPSDPKDLMKAGSMMLGQLAGVPSSLFPATPSESLEAAANKLGPSIPWSEMGNAEKAQFIKDNPSLKPLYDKQQAARTGRSAEITDAKYEALNSIADLASKNPQEYRKQAGDIVAEAAIRRDEAMRNGKIDEFDTQSPIGKAVDGYYSAIKAAQQGAVTDYDMQEKLGADYLAGLDPEMRERVIKELAYSKDETYGQLLRDRQTLAPYFNAPDQAFQMAKDAASQAPEGSPLALLNNYNSLDEFRSDIKARTLAIIAEINAQGGQQISISKADGVVSSIEAAMGLDRAIKAARAAYIAYNPEYADLLNRWYGISQELLDMAGKLKQPAGAR